MRVLVIPFTLVVLFAGIAAIIWTHSRSDGGLVDLRGLQQVSIVLSDEGFAPRAVMIDRGTTVVFSTTRPYQFWPASNEHPAHSIFPEFDPKRPLDPDTTWAFAFDRAGEWRFHDHVRSYYTGTIYVVE